MDTKGFAAIWKKERDDLYSSYVKKAEGTAVSRIIDELKLDEASTAKVHKAIDCLLTDVFYLFMMGLAGSASIGGVQQDYRLFDEDGNQIQTGGDLEAEAYEHFQGDR